MKNRSELREVAMKVLYQIDILEDAKQEVDKTSLIKELLEIENDFVNELIFTRNSVFSIFSSFLVEPTLFCFVDCHFMFCI